MNPGVQGGVRCEPPTLDNIYAPQDATVAELTELVRGAIAHCGMMKRQFEAGLNAKGEVFFSDIDSLARKLGYVLVPVRRASRLVRS